jgi:hypothetical protein
MIVLRSPSLQVKTLHFSSQIQILLTMKVLCIAHKVGLLLTWRWKATSQKGTNKIEAPSDRKKHTFLTFQI